jgi:PhnB protein
MINEAVFNFNVEKDTRTIAVERSFNAPLDPVWAAWTNAEILCQWWAPKPYKCVIKSLDFREGGRWLYYMEGPQGDRHWCFFDYESVLPKSYFSGSDAFCDEHGVANDIKPKVRWEARFRERNGGTLVHMTLHFGSPKDLEQIIQMGFKEGFTMGLNQLEELLSSYPFKP